MSKKVCFLLKKNLSQWKWRENEFPPRYRLSLILKGIIIGQPRFSRYIVPKICFLNRSKTTLASLRLIVVFLEINGPNFLYKSCGSSTIFFKLSHHIWTGVLCLHHHLFVIEIVSIFYFDKKFSSCKPMHAYYIHRMNVFLYWRGN